MALTPPQRLAIGALVLAGLLGTAAVLLAGRHAAGDGAAHAEAGHADSPAAPGDTPASAAGHAEPGPRRLQLSAEQIRTAGIALQAAGPAQLRSSTAFPGELRVNADATAHVVPRLAGVAEAVPVTLGQTVGKGQLLAVIASTALAEQRSELLTAQQRRQAAQQTHDRERQLWQDQISAQQDYLDAQATLREADIAVRNAQQKLAAVGAPARSSALNRFELRAPFAGTVVDKHLSLGEAVKDDASIFTIADLRTVWAEFTVAPQDLATVRVGQPVTVTSTAREGSADGRIATVGALLGAQTRTAPARVTLDNADGSWRPGLFVTVTVHGAARDVPLAVAADAVQTVDGTPMVFKAVAGGFEATPVQLGRSDGTTVELLGGIAAGDQVAAVNAFVLRSELGKSTAEHAH